MFPTSSLVSQSGVTTRRQWGSRPSRATLELEFSNITDANASALLSAYHSAEGSFDSLTLPDIVFNGTDATLKTWLSGSATGAGLVWSFTEGSPPTVNSVARGIHEVSISLTAELR